MTKKAMWIIVVILLPYYIFTSGLWYWATRCEETIKFNTPFSWSLSAEERGFMPISTKGDMDCVLWLMDKRNTSLKIACNAQATCLLQGHIGYPAGTKPEDKPWCELNYIFALDECYLFLVEWNIKNNAYVAGHDIGLRTICPFSLEDIGGGYMRYVNQSPQVRYASPVEVGESVRIKEVYRSGDSVIYKTDKVEVVEDE